MCARAKGEGCKDTHDHKKLSPATFELTEKFGIMRNRSIAAKIYMATGEKIVLTGPEKYMPDIDKLFALGLHEFKKSIREGTAPDMGEYYGMQGVTGYFRRVPCYKKENGSIFGPIGKMQGVSTEEMMKLNAMLEAAKLEFGEPSLSSELCKTVSYKFAVKLEAYPENTEPKEQDYTVL